MPLSSPFLPLPPFLTLGVVIIPFSFLFGFLFLHLSQFSFLFPSIRLSFSFHLVPSKFQGFLWLMIGGELSLRIGSKCSILFPPSPSSYASFVSLTLNLTTTSSSNCPFTWKLWGRLFRLVNITWVALPSTLDLIATIHISKQAAKIWWLCLHDLLWTVWKKRKHRLFEDSFGNLSFVWDYFLFPVASWTRSSVILSSIPFNSLLCNFGSILFHFVLFFFL